VSPAPRAAAVLALVALAALLVGPLLAALAAVALVAATVADALAVRSPPTVARRVAPILARGVPVPFAVVLGREGGGTDRVRQPVPPDLALAPPEDDRGLASTLTPLRRGRHVLEPVAVRSEGPLGLGRWHHRPGEAAEVFVYPDLPAARRLALAVRQGRFRDAGRVTRGPLGLGTDFESIRDYQPDDDVRQVNWPASLRQGRPMSNQYRVEQDREVMVLLDTGRLMAAPLGDRTRLDAAVDAAVAVALVADELGDRCGLLAFDGELRRHLAPRRAGADAIVRALVELEPRPQEPDYELAFRAVQGTKRSLVLVLCDLLDEAAARPLVDAVPVLARGHAVVVASAQDPDLEQLLRTPPERPRDVYATGVALDVLAARARVARRLERAGARVVEAAAAGLGAACVRAYLQAKARARL